MGAVSTRGKCNTCGQQVAWKERLGSSKWVLCDPERDAAGNVVYLQVSNGQGRVVNRPKPSATRHVCSSSGYAGQADVAAVQHKTAAAIVDNDFTTEDWKPFVRAEMVRILDSYGIRQETVSTIEVKRADGTTAKTDQPAHPMLAELLRYMSRGESVYLHGPAGSGKTHGACQAAEALGLECAVVSMPGTSLGKLLGFVDAGGRETTTAFGERWVKGGVVVLDEFDRSIPSVAASLNSALANRMFIMNGQPVRAHKDFMVVATGNTDMRGATRTYLAAQPLDLATAARFAFLKWDYDAAFETELVKRVLPSCGPLLKWGRALRARLAEDQQQTVLCGPREMLKIAEALVAGHTLADAAEAWVWRGFDHRAYDVDFALPEVTVK